MKNLKLFIIAIVVAIVVIMTTNTDKVKENLSWVFEDDESHGTLPELSNKEIEEVANKNKSFEVEKSAEKIKEKNIDNPKEDLEEDNQN